MARLTAGDATLEQLPWAYRKGHGKAIGWKEGARCRTITERVSSPKHGGAPTIWQVDEDKDYVRADGEHISGAKLIELALTHCALCSVQWDCASYALSCDERSGVWGMTIEELDWLRTQVRKPQDLVAHAKAVGVSVRVAVRARKNRS